MARIRIIFEDHPAIAQPVEKVFTVENSQLTRIVQALKVKLRRNGPQGQPGEALTNLEAIQRSMRVYWDMLRQLTQQHEAEEAARAAAQTVVPVEAQED